MTDEIKNFINSMSNFDADEVTAVIVSVLKYISGRRDETITEGFSDDTDTAGGLLGLRALNYKTRNKKAFTEQQTDTLMDELTTPEIERLLSDEKPKRFDWVTTNPQVQDPGFHWNR